MSDACVLKHLEDVAPVACPCGQARRMITAADNDILSIHRVSIGTQARKHYHRRPTEYYVILEGSGEMELNEERVPVAPGDVIMIPPLTRHALRGRFEIINVVSPPFDPADEYTDSMVSFDMDAGP